MEQSAQHMIIVIADDLTGAAELGGIGLRYHLQVEIVHQIGAPIATETDLLVINTDTRSMLPGRAMKRLIKVLRWIKELPYTHLFKKVDSVLRGHVLVEIIAQMHATDAKRALLLPANPRLGRTICNGKYYVQGQEIRDTCFSEDPEFPIKHTDVLQMLGEQPKVEVQVKSWGDTFPEEGIVIGEVSSEEDMRKWVQIAPEGVMFAGASSAFIAFLEQRVIGSTVEKTDTTETFAGFRKPCLYVSGSNYEKSTQRIKAWRMVNEPVCYLPIGQSGKEVEAQELKDWIERVKAAITYHQKAIIAFDNEIVSAMDLTPSFLRNSMAKIISSLLNEVFIQELVIEGGATAGAILAHRQIDHLTPIEELAPGLIRCTIHEDPKIWITLKPGSYNWYML